MLEILAKKSEFHSPNHFQLPKKHYLYHQGEELNKTYILREGWILLSHLSEQGKRQVIRSVLSGDLLGFQPDLNAPSLYSAIAVQDSIICDVPNILEMCKHNSELALKLVWTEACEITLTEIYMLNIAHRNAQEKVAFMALELFQRLKFRGLNNGHIIPFPLTQEDIADTLGLTAIHVNRTLHKLEQNKLISIHNHELTILDYKRLNALVGLELKPMQKCCNIGSVKS
jgi:CRP-like cAMP-binding protein